MKREAVMVNYSSFHFLSFTLGSFLLLTFISQGYQYTTMVENRYLATKNKLDELAKDNEDLL